MKILKTSLKILAGLIILLIILAMAAYFALTRWINPNDFKPKIIQIVQQETGRTLTMPGDLSWSFFPNLGIHIGDAALSNPPGFGQPTFAEIDSANLFVDWGALLHGHIVANSIAVNGLELHLISNGTQNNWTFPSTSPSSGDASAAAKTSLSLMLQEVDLNNASITYDNNQAKSHYVVNNLNVEIPDFSLISPMNIKAAGNFSGANIFGSFQASTGFYYDLDKSVLNLNNLALSTHATYTTDNGKNISLVINATGNMVVDLVKEIVNLSGINFTLNSSLSGTLNAKFQNFTKMNYSGNVAIPSFSLENLLNSLGQTLPDLPNKNQFSNTSLSTNFTGNLTRLSLQNMKLGVGNSMIQGNVNVTSFIPFALNENVNINQLDLADFTNLNGARLPMQNANISGRMSVDSFSSDDLPSSLNASQKITVQSIVLKGFDLGALLAQVDTIVNNILDLKKVSDAYQSIQGQMLQLQSSQKIDPDNGKQTNLGNLNAQIQIHNGVITTPVLVLSGPLVKVTGAGNINLNQKSMNYMLNSQVIASNRDIVKTLNIPYSISGPFSNLQQGVDWASVQGQIMAFIAGQLGRTVTSIVKTVVTSPVGVVSGVAQGAADAVSGVAKGAASALGHIFGEPSSSTSAQGQ